MPKNHTNLTVLMLVGLLLGSVCSQSCANTQDPSLLLQAGTALSIQETCRWPIPTPPQLQFPAWGPTASPSATQSPPAASKSPRVLIRLCSLQQSRVQQQVREQFGPHCSGRKIFRKGGPIILVHQRGCFLGESSLELFDQFARWSLFGELHCWRIPLPKLSEQYP
jgi:hypothetical protein